MPCHRISGAGMMRISWGSGSPALQEGRGVGFALLHPAMKSAGGLPKLQGDTDTNKHPKPQPEARPKSGLCLGFSLERLSSCICKVLEVTALSSVTGGSQKGVRQLACYLPDPISQCLRFCERVAPDKAQGMHSPCIQVQGVFSFFIFFS